MPDRIPVAVINATTILDDAAIIKMVAALQVQVSRDLAPIWNVDAVLGFVGKGETPPPHMWWLVACDTSDEAGTLGYHDTTAEGLPIGKAFAKTCAAYGSSFSVDLSHELVEMLVDPNVNQLVSYDGAHYPVEIADAVEADAEGYDIDGVLVSNFVTPAYFKCTAGPWDFLKHLRGPLPEMTAGGYLSVERGGVWQQVFAARGVIFDRHAASFAAARPKVGSRRHRRTLASHDWLNSTAHT